MGEQATAKVANTAVVSTQVERAALQRACDCGGHTIGGSECDSCKKEKESGAGRTLQRSASGSDQVDEVPPIIFICGNSIGQDGV